MQQLIRINGIRERGRRIGASLAILCSDAGLSPSTVYRWVSGEVEPRMHGYEATCDALEKALEARETEILKHLTPASAAE